MSSETKGFWDIKNQKFLHVNKQSLFHIYESLSMSAFHSQPLCADKLCLSEHLGKFITFQDLKTVECSISL